MEVDEEVPEDQEKRWDEGLTKEERAEAKRKYKNRRSAERWRRRKKEEKARTKAGTTGDDPADSDDDVEPVDLIAARTDGECPLAYTVQQTARNMLFEHSKLGKAEERNFLFQLQQLAAYSIVPGGFQQYKEEILLIAERAVDILQGGGPPQLKAAQRYASLPLNPTKEWFSLTTADLQQVSTAFVAGKEGELKVPLSMCAQPTARFSLKQLSNLPAPVQMEVYYHGVNSIKQLLPLAMNGRAQSQAAMQQVSHLVRELMMLLSAFVIGNPSMFIIARTVRQTMEPSIAQLMSATAAMGLSIDTCRQLWQVWDEMMQQMPPLLASKQVLEREIEEIINRMDHSGRAPYVDLLEKVRELLVTYQTLLDVNVLTELRCTMEILTPFQCSMLHAAYLPQMSPREAWVNGVDPVLRMSAIFQRGLIPYRMV